MSAEPDELLRKSPFIEAQPREKPAIPQIRDSWSRFGFPRGPVGKQLRAPYVWSLVNSQNMQTLALGNLVFLR